jgi:hypothetical protein
MDESQKAALAAELAKPEYADLIANQRYQELAAMLNEKPLVDNPTPPQQVDKRISVDDFVKALKPQEVVTVYQNSALAQAYTQSLQMNDRKLTKSLWRGMKTLVSPETQAAIEAMQDAKESDPAHQAKIAGQSVADGLGVGRLTPADLQSLDAQRAAAA